MTTSIPSRQAIVTLDLEGVLIPEIWIAVAHETGIDALLRTTRDEPDYDALMRYRLDILSQTGLTMSKIQGVIAQLQPMAGARAFLDELRAITQVIILSDTFEQFASPLMPKLGMPTIFCHRLITDGDDIIGYRLRQDDQKRRAVRAFHELNFRVVAAGDSYNDTAMLSEADAGFLFRAPETVQREFHQFEALSDYDQLYSAITGSLTD